MAQDADRLEVVQEAIDTCPVDCIAWVTFQELAHLESRRRYQKIVPIGIVGDRKPVA
jgi:ferredoxin